MKSIRIIATISALFLLTLVANAQAATGFTKINSSTVSTATFTDPSCPLQSSCYYQVTAVDSVGFESGPATCSATALCVGGNTAVATMPSSGTHTVTVTWNAVSGAASYNVYRHIGPLAPSNLNTVVN